jgi:Xaa-Pro aminopeptidase
MTNDEFAGELRAIIPDRTSSKLYVAPLPEKGQITADLVKPLRERIDWMKTQAPPGEVVDPAPIIRKFRTIKDSYEIALISKAAHISAVAHRQAMMSCRPGMSEYELQAVYEYVFRRLGSEYNAYPCIVGAAENSIVLHYEMNRRTINDGDIVLADCGAEYHYYASDLTRTYPANGKFSGPQREIYQLVLNAQNEAIAMMKPGVSWRDVSARADSILEEGLFKLGIINEKERKELRKFFPHGLGHPIGLDVHDVYSLTMEPGVVYTVEPGIYVPENADGVDPKFFNIGVRIEDDVLITPEGHAILTVEAPREIDEIESLMQKRGIGEMPLK